MSQVYQSYLVVMSPHRKQRLTTSSVLQHENNIMITCVFFALRNSVSQQRGNKFSAISWGQMARVPEEQGRLHSRQHQQTNGPSSIQLLITQVGVESHLCRQLVKRIGENTPSCHTPFAVEKDSETVLSHDTEMSWSVYHLIMRTVLTTVGGKSLWSSFLNQRPWSTQSNALHACRKHPYTGDPLQQYLAVWVDTPELKTRCSKRNFEMRESLYYCVYWGRAGDQVFLIQEVTDVRKDFQTCMITAGRVSYILHLCREHVSNSSLSR